MTKLFVGGLTYAKTSSDLQAMFEAFGTVQSAQVITDKFTGQSKGFGFVEMANDDEAQAAIKALEGSDQDGRRLGVSVARPREERPQGGGDRNGSNNRGGGGGYDNGRNRY
jgi:RNA recognition motif-containing protein